MKNILNTISDEVYEEVEIFSVKLEIYSLFESIMSIYQFVTLENFNLDIPWNRRPKWFRDLGFLLEEAFCGFTGTVGLSILWNIVLSGGEDIGALALIILSLVIYKKHQNIAQNRPNWPFASTTDYYEV